MNRVKLASAAGELSGKFNRLQEKHALKSLVENVVFDVMKRFSEDDYDKADATIKEREESGELRVNENGQVVNKQGTVQIQATRKYQESLKKQKDD